MAIRPRWLTPVDNFKRHGFAGANTVVMAMLDRHRAELGVTAHGLDDAIISSREFLKTTAEIKSLSALRVGDQLAVDVEVTNNTGHKLPTGYPSRRVWIDFQVIDRQGGQVFRSGRMHTDGSIAGVDSDTTPSGFEPHRRLITGDDQVQVYESIMHDTDDALTHTLLRAEGYLKDNRIPPSGFDKHEVPDNIAVIGDAGDDADFGDGSDRVTYRFDAPPGHLQILVTLRYQPLASGFMHDLFRDAELPLVARMRDYWEQAEVRAETLASAQLTIGR